MISFLNSDSHTVTWPELLEIEGADAYLSGICDTGTLAKSKKAWK